MSLDCCCDYEPPAFYNVEIRKARKQHKCEECSGPINSGDRYEHVVGKWEWVDTFKTCERCVDLRTWVRNNIPCLCWAHGNLHNDCREAVREAAYRAPKETAGLRFGFARRLYAIDKFKRAHDTLPAH